MNSQFIHNQSQNIEILLDHILKISGDKIVTLAIGNQPFAIDIQANGQLAMTLVTNSFS